MKDKDLSSLKMSKNCEFFCNVCNFMKYLLNDILPNEKPTESIKVAMQDVLIAIVTYADKWQLDIYSMCSLSNEVLVTDLCGIVQNVCNSKATNQKYESYKSLKLNDHTEKDLTKKLENVSGFDTFLGNQLQNFGISVKQEIVSPPLSPTQEVSVVKGIRVENDLRSCTNQVPFEEKHKKKCAPLSDKINGGQFEFPEKKISNNDIPSVVKTSENCSLESKMSKVEPTSVPLKSKEESSNKDNRAANSKSDKKVRPENNHNPSKKQIRKTNRIIDFEDKIDSFEENFLKFYFFSDSNDYIEDEVFLLTHNSDSKGKKQREIFVLPEYLKVREIPLELEALNFCLHSKLISHVYYCYICSLTFEDLDEFLDHSNDWNIHGSPSKNKEVYSVIELCESCSFTVYLPDSMIGKLMNIHEQTHDLSNKALQFSNNALPTPPRTPQDECTSFVDSLLLYKKNFEGSDIPTFLGICLICKASFKAPLDWNYHVYEYRHLLQKSEKIEICRYCSLVILGHVKDNIHQYFEFNSHRAHCHSLKLKPVVNNIVR